MIFLLSSGSGSPLGRNGPAPSLVSRICHPLALHTAVPVDMAAAASLGRYPHLVWTRRIGTGLGRPVRLLGARWTGSMEAVVFEVENHAALPLEISGIAADADILLTDVAPDQRP